MASRRRRRGHEEEHENHERWLVTYADMLTLLMVLFIVMFAMSSVDEKKYNALRSGLADGFGQQSSFMKGSDALLDGEGETVAEELVSDKAFQGLPADQKAQVVAAVQGQERVLQRAKYTEAETEVKRLEKIRARLESALAKHGLQDDVRTTIDDRGLVVSLVSKHVVFRADVAVLSPRGQLVVDTLAPVLRDVPDPLRIDGHTNQVKVHPKYYATDWDLSAARAVTVLRRMNEVGHIPQDRLSMSAFGHERPLEDPSRPGSQQVNKRVDIVVLSGIPSESRELLDDVARSRSGTEGES
ncbi:chemotaxis protein MotB [Nocardioides ginsengisegetis]|uniref:Chemotaxis protein MotB n=1 Tax=Nocardioides ginsengisegetis TaxID=661491 RepID=A0A7W3J2B8_9ACTN|nr:flagellar motor protein MotB [Nocardioides ginsengisegetis]MBA8805023.1 chemotaxis protein MotB [Nocardioides ginsengisegetis]